MIKELTKLANDLDKKGFHKEASYIDSILKRANEEELHTNDENEEPTEEAKPSKWHKFKMSRVVEEMSKNDFDSLSFEINDYRIRITKVEKND